MKVARPWLWLTAALVPLAVLFALQYRALVKLEETSAAAHRMSLKGYARAILKGVEELNREKASALDVAASLFAGGRAGELAGHFAAQDARGVKRFFVIGFGDGGSRLFYDPDGRPLAPEAESGEAWAIEVASARWRLLSREGAEVESVSLEVDEQDPENRVVLRPFLDASSRVLGVTGFVVDEGYFRREVLPGLIETQSAELPEPLRGNVFATVRDRQGDVLFGSEDGATAAELTPPFRFVFTDWTLAVATRSATPEEWARWSFGIHLSLSLLMTAALLGAIALALRSATRATKLSQMKTEFVSNVSHELRTPLSSIRVFGEFLRLGRVTDPGQVREYGEYIETESRRLTHLVDNILDFSKIESGRKRYRFEKTDVRELVDETLKALEVRLRQEGFSLDFRAPAEPVPPVLADPEAIAQAITNLVDNAVKYSGEERTVRVELGRANGYVTLAVNDRGPGIRPDEQQRIFEKFYRVSTGLVHDAKGSGLGLAIVKHIVEAHRGTVGVESRPGAGSTFTIHLPANGA